MHGCDHVHYGISVLETDGFAPSIPAGCEGCKVCVTAGGFVIGPPGFELLVPSLASVARPTPMCVPHTVVCP